jgi:hypothetical protein
MRLMTGNLLLCAWLAGCASSARPAAQRDAAPCALSAKPELIARSAGELHQVWQIPEVPALYGARLPADPSLAAYTGAIRARADVDPIALLRRQHDLYVASGNAALLPEAKNSEMVLSGKAGRIAPINCLEALLYGAHVAGRSMIAQPSEFGAFLLRRAAGAGAELRIYFSSMERSGGRISREVTARVDDDIKRGWQFVGHLHNHPFFFDRVVGDRNWTTKDSKDDIAGAVAPSVTDVHFYNNILDDTGPQAVFITNGFHTLRLSPAEIRLLQARP